TVVRSLTPEERGQAAGQIASFRLEVHRFAAWVSPEQSQILFRFADTIESAFAPDARLGSQKGAVLYQLVNQSLDSGKRCALVARNEAQVNELRSWLKQKGFWTKPEVYSSRTLPEDELLDRLICTSWLGGESMKQIASSFIAPKISVVAYPFENRWLK